MTKIGIIGAMTVEVAMLKKAMSSASVKSRAGLRFYEGELCGLPVIVVRCGVGKVNAAICAQLLISEYRVTHIINTGIAGAILPELRPLDVVLSTDAVEHDVDVTGFGYPATVIPGMKSVFKADARLLAAAESAGKRLGVKTRRARIATGDSFIDSAEKKQRIRELCGPACVEMEGAAIAHAAKLNGVPFVIIRSISDMADDSGAADSLFNEKAAAGTSARLVMGALEALGTR
jgi:adenosylhomocysteine nucleosidase